MSGGGTAGPGRPHSGSEGEMWWKRGEGEEGEEGGPEGEVLD